MGTYVRRMGALLLLWGALLLGVWTVAVPPIVEALDVGDAAPDFTLRSTNGEKISLSQFRGKKLVLLEFYGADFFPT
jgi:hypothetical protein